MGATRAFHLQSFEFSCVAAWRVARAVSNKNHGRYQDEERNNKYKNNSKTCEKNIKEEFGVSPEQIPDYLGLTGDAVDCITGVPGVGAVKARELLQNFRDMDEIYDNLHTVAQLKLRGAKRLADQLEAHRDLAELSRTLATIVCEVDDQAEEFGRVELADLD